ncbi:MAG TPA: DUF4856 domain-containing protein [Ferruginibacter sp.]|jgi:hypothetical protein|nr:DUF4856 domain-containing protein [Ferruginibacter sp.]
MINLYTMKKISIAFIIAILFCWGCTKQITSLVPSAAPFPYPTTYSFPDANFTTQQNVLDTIDQLMAAINQGNTANTVVDTAAVKTFFNNNLIALCIPAAQTDILRYIDSVGLFSHSTVPGIKGTAGVSVSPITPDSTYLFSDSGFVYSELAKTALMEGLIAYQIERVYLGDSVNISIDTTAMKGVWDAAFGYYGVPVDFPTNKTGLRYWGYYSNLLDTTLNSNATIMNNFLIGRAATDNNYIQTSPALVNGTSYAAITDAENIILAFDNLIAGVAIHELTEAHLNDSLGDPVIARADLSRSWGFLNSLNYNVSPLKTTATQSILAAYGTDLYNFDYSYQKVDSIKTVIAGIYSIPSISF